MDDKAREMLVEDAVRRAVYGALGSLDPSLVVVGISNRHVHLTEEDFAVLFGQEAIQPMRYVRQRGEYAATQTVAVHGPKGSFARVRVMGPCRKASQVELSTTDCFTLGIKPVLAVSGSLAQAAPVEVAGPCGRISLPHAAIVASRHLHLGTVDAERLGLSHLDRVSVRLGGGRGGVLGNVVVRVQDSYLPEFHLDTDEGNALGVRTGAIAQILLPGA
ncbi:MULTISPECIES: phosphate propanoyltransferase [unclassified Luteococcus]|uniref:phosphate propanoyltransferase n=1 Tax=unclassified Luteococcus TaxID=2639923 RepID=UPI00313BF2AD